MANFDIEFKQSHGNEPEDSLLIEIQTDILNSLTIGGSEKGFKSCIESALKQLKKEIKQLKFIAGKLEGMAKAGEKCEKNPPNL
jgi:hypothetical protein